MVVSPSSPTDDDDGDDDGVGRKNLGRDDDNVSERSLALARALMEASMACSTCASGGVDRSSV